MIPLYDEDESQTPPKRTLSLPCAIAVWLGAIGFLGLCYLAALYYGG